MDNMETTDVLALLDNLYVMVTEAWSVPLGNDKCIIERAKAIEIINDIKTNLPTALAEAKRLVTARDEFIGGAKRDAEAIRKTAEASAAEMVSEQRIVKEAERLKAKKIAEAEDTVKTLQQRSYDYVNGMMAEAEGRLKEALAAISQSQDAFRDAARERFQLDDEPAAGAENEEE